MITGSNKIMRDIDELMGFFPENLFIELSTIDKENIWHETAVYYEKNTAVHRKVFLNYLCLNTFVQWLKNELDLAKKIQIPEVSQDLYQRWEFVNGIELTFNQARLVLIPQEQGSISEFRIPQEWVDIPHWAAHYYLAVQLNLSENWLRIWGFISYEQVREKAKYDSIDRTYCLNNRDLIADINIMWVASELCQLHKPQVKPLASLSQAQAKAIIEHLSKPTVYSPRLDISFAQWAGILASDEYRQILSDQRKQKLQEYVFSNTKLKVQNLSLWYKHIFKEGWRSVDDFLNLTDTRAFQFRSDFALNEVYVKGAKLIDLGIQLESKSVALLIGLSPQIDNKVGIRVQLYPAYEETYLPASMKLTLLSESGKTLQSVESRSFDNYIQLKRFKLPLGKLFSIQVALKDVTIKENFVLEGLACSEI